jgi:hypothetical protein
MRIRGVTAIAGIARRTSAAFAGVNSVAKAAPRPVRVVLTDPASVVAEFASLLAAHRSVSTSSLATSNVHHKQVCSRSPLD